MDQFVLTWAMKDPDEGFLSCGYECIGSKAACVKIVKSYENRAVSVMDRWTDQTYPYAEYTELRLSSGAELLLCIERLR